MNQYTKHLRSSDDVCSTCFGRIRRDAVRHRKYDTDETYSERVRWHTIVEDVPDAVVSDAGTLFCECGADGAHCRIWDDKEVDREQFTELLTAALKTAVELGLVETRSELETIATTARNWFDAGASVDRTLEEGFSTLPQRREATEVTA